MLATWTVSRMNMATSHQNIFVNIPLITRKRDWFVWKFQEQHALKAAGQWESITGTANIKAEDCEIKKQKAFYLELQCMGQKFMPTVMSCQTKKYVGCTMPIL